MLGLALLPDHGDRFARVVASNTGLPEGQGANEFIEQWLAFSQSVDVLPVGALVQGGTTRELSAAEVAAYEAPYPDGSYQAAPKRFPVLIPIQPDNPGVPQAKAIWAYLETWEKPFLTVFGDQDQVAYQAGAHLAAAASDPRRPGSAPPRARGPEPLHPGGCAGRAGGHPGRLRPDDVRLRGRVAPAATRPVRSARRRTAPRPHTVGERHDHRRHRPGADRRRRPRAHLHARAHLRADPRRPAELSRRVG